MSSHTHAHPTQATPRRLLCVAITALLLAGCESAPKAPELPSVPAMGAVVGDEAQSAGYGACFVAQPASCAAARAISVHLDASWSAISTSVDCRKRRPSQGHSGEAGLTDASVEIRGGLAMGTLAVQRKAAKPGAQRRRRSRPSNDTLAQDRFLADKPQYRPSQLHCLM